MSNIDAIYLSEDNDVYRAVVGDVVVPFNRTLMDKFYGGKEGTIQKLLEEELDTQWAISVEDYVNGQIPEGFGKLIWPVGGNKVHDAEVGDIVTVRLNATRKKGDKVFPAGTHLTGRIHLIGNGANPIWCGLATEEHYFHLELEKDTDEYSGTLVVIHEQEEEVDRIAELFADTCQFSLPCCNTPGDTLEVWSLDDEVEFSIQDSRRNFERSNVILTRDNAEKLARALNDFLERTAN